MSALNWREQLLQRARRLGYRHLVLPLFMLRGRIVAAEEAGQDTRELQARYLELLITVDEDLTYRETADRWTVVQACLGTTAFKLPMEALRA